MKRTQLKDALRNIGKKKIAFLSICIIVLLGVGSFLWARFLIISLNKKTTEYYAEHKFAHIEMMSSLGITDRDIEKISAEDYVIAAEGVKQYDAKIFAGKEKTDIQLISLTTRVNISDVIEGVLPSAENECSVDSDTARSLGIKIGDKVRISVPGDMLKNSELTVVGTVFHPGYLRRNTVSYVIVSADAFDEEATHGVYTKAVVLLDVQSNVDILTNQYYEHTASSEAKLAKLAVALGAERDVEIRSAANEQINAAKEEIRIKTGDAQKEIEDGERTLRSELEKAEKELREAEIKIADGEKEIAEGEKKLRDGEKELAEKKAEAEAALADARRQIEEGRAKIRDGESELYEALNEIKNAEEKLNPLMEKVNEALALAAQARENIDQAKLTLYDYIDQIDVKEKLESAWQNAENEYYIYKAVIMNAYLPVVRAIINGTNADTLEAAAQMAIDAAREEFLNNENIDFIIESAKIYISEANALASFLSYKEFFFSNVEAIAKAAVIKPALEAAKEKLGPFIEQADDALDTISQLKETVERTKDTLYGYITDESIKAKLDAAWQDAEDAYITYKSMIEYAYLPLIEAIVNDENDTLAMMAAQQLIDAAKKEFLENESIDYIIQTAQTYISQANDLAQFMSNKEFVFSYVEMVAKAVVIRPLIDQAMTRLQPILDQAKTTLDMLPLVVSQLEQSRELLFEYLSSDNIKAMIDIAWQNAEDTYYNYKDKVMKAYLPVVQAMIDGIDATNIESSAQKAIDRAKEELLGSGIVGSIDTLIRTYLPEGELLEKYNSAKATLLEYIEGIAKATAAKPLIDDADKKLQDGKNKTEDGSKELEEARAELKKAEILFEREEKNANEQLSAAEAEIESGRAEIEKAKAELEAGKKEYAEGKAKYEEEKAKGEKLLSDARAELAAQTADANAKIAAAEAEIASLGESNWVVQNRSSNQGFLDISSAVTIFSVASGGLAVMFMIVGAIVCFSTIALIVDEQKKLVGATKAFGFFGGEVFLKYAVFSMAATILGLVVGFGLALVFDSAMLRSFDNTYIFNQVSTKIDVKVLIIVCVAAIALSIITTLISCREVLKKPASALMSGNDNLQKRKKSANAKAHGSVFSRLIRRNMRSEISRVFVSIVIILGCTGLIGTGFTIKYGYSGMMSKQYGSIIKYDIKAKTADLTDDEIKEVDRIISEYGASVISVSETGYALKQGANNSAAIVISTDDKTLQDYFAVNDFKTGKQLSLPDDGVIVNVRFAETGKLNVGDTVMMYDGALNLREVKIAGIYRNYNGRTFIMSNEARRNLLGADGADNFRYINLNGADIDEVLTALDGVSENISLYRGQEIPEFMLSFMKVANAAIIGMSIVAILMALIILTNLTSIFVNRRMKEIAIMRINGFGTKETMKYLIGETIITNVIGIGLGVGLGSIVGYVMERLTESADVMFDRSFSIPAWLIAVSVTALFSVIINAVGFKKTKKLNLTDAK